MHDVICSMLDSDAQCGIFQIRLYRTLFWKINITWSYIFHLSLQDAFQDTLHLPSVRGNKMENRDEMGFQQSRKFWDLLIYVPQIFQWHIRLQTMYRMIWLRLAPSGGTTPLQHYSWFYSAQSFGPSEILKLIDPASTAASAPEIAERTNNLGSEQLSKRIPSDGRLWWRKLLHLVLVVVYVLGLCILDKKQEISRGVSLSMVVYIYNFSFSQWKHWNKKQFAIEKYLQ